jgi:hypothetical protein
MKAQMARFVISLVAMAIAAVVFMVARNGWVSMLVPGLIVAIGFLIAHLAFRRLADPETIRSDLEERVRNQHL